MDQLVDLLHKYEAQRGRTRHSLPGCRRWSASIAS
jgi:hypothetical protein